MSKKEILKVLFIIGAVFLSIFVILIIMNFIRTKENIDFTPTEEPKTITFRNSSSMTEQEIRILVEEKRSALKSFFQNAQYYNIGDVGKDYTSEDNEKYLVVGEGFLNELRNLLTLDAYNVYWNEMEELVSKDNIDIKERIYKTRKDLFDSIYVTSAIAFYDVTEENIILESATDEEIIARENIKLCNDNDICERNDFYYLSLEKEDETWKINDFTTLIKNK